MDKEGVYLQLYKRASAPQRDYYGLTISEKEVILNVWNVTHGPHVFPKRRKTSIDDFPKDKVLMEEVARLFGDHVLNYCLELTEKDQPKLQCLPTKTFLYILRMLAANDILHLRQTSKIFFELCDRDLTWKVLFGKRCRRKPSHLELKTAEEQGWKSLLMTKVLLQNNEAPRTIKNALFKPQTIKRAKDEKLTSQSALHLDTIYKSPIKPKFKGSGDHGSPKNINLSANHTTKETTKKVSFDEAQANPFEIPEEYYKLSQKNPDTAKRKSMSNAGMKSVTFSDLVDGAKNKNVNVVLDNNRKDAAKMRTVGGFIRNLRFKD